tara:strand:- start:3911 stop:4396 length:486 start_codon:yes stop_codon:yes gene_type:complete
MKESGSGTISRIGNNSKSFQMQETEDKWFGAFNMSQLQDAKVGDKVEFFYESRTKDGRTFHNISGNIKKVATAESTGSSSVTPTSATLPTKDISIIRQSSTTNAVKVAELMIQQGEKYNEEQLMAFIKRVRADFVKYSSLQDTEDDDKEPNEGVVALKAAQ